MPDPSIHVFATALFLGVALEFAAFFLVPRLLARAAFVKAGAPRRIPLSARAREALSTAPDHTGGYRVPAARRFELARLGLPEKLPVPGFVARVYASRGFVTARAPYTFGNKVVALARIDIVENDGAVEVTGRFVPVTWPTLLVVAPIAGIATLCCTGANRGAFEAIAFGAMFLGINLAIGYFFSRRAMTNAVDGVYHEIERAVYAADR